MFGIATWLSGYDQFGTWAKFNYRGQSGYGTSWGGFCSLLVSTITFLFIVVMLWGWIYRPEYAQNTIIKYLGSDLNENIPTYTIK